MTAPRNNAAWTLANIAKTTVPMSAEVILQHWLWFARQGSASLVCESHEALRLALERHRDQTAAKLTAVLAIAETTTDTVASEKLLAILKG